VNRKVFFILAGTLLSVILHAASFDCPRASAKVEKIICGDAELSKLDEELGTTYKTALQDAQHAKVIRESQKSWLRDVRARCLSPTTCGCSDATTCLKETYERQLSLLKDPIITTMGSRFVHERTAYTVARLANGKVLFSAELYDPISGLFTATVDIGSSVTATLLPNGKVLLGGQLYDPALSTLGAIDDFSSPRYEQTATLLATGQVLIVGTDEPVGFGVKKTVLYDPLTGHVAVGGSLATRGEFYTATLLPNGKVLFTGGYGKDIDDYLASAELYDPTTRTFSTTGSLTEARVRHTATLCRMVRCLLSEECAQTLKHFPVPRFTIRSPATS
jgi:uncharacterized protein YecT (DUF1311 family)